MKNPLKQSKTPAIFSRSRSENFDYFLKGSRSVQMTQLRDMYKDLNDYNQHPLYQIFQILKRNNIKLHYDYDGSFDYERVQIWAWFSDGQLHCSSGGNFYESPGVWLKGKKAMEFLRDELMPVQPAGNPVVDIPEKSTAFVSGKTIG